MRPLEIDKKRELARRAVAVMQVEGLDVSMSRLADALDVKRPTLLYHFPTRGHIVEQALEEMLSEQSVFVMERVLQHEHPIEQLYAQVRAVHEFHHGREGRVVFLSQAIAAVSRERIAELIAVGNSVFEPHRRALASRIRAGIEAGTVAPCDPEAVIALARAVIDGLMVQRVMTGIELAPVHELLWTSVLRPLIRPRSRKEKSTCSASISAAAGVRSASPTGASSTKRTPSRRSRPIAKR